MTPTFQITRDRKWVIVDTNVISHILTIGSEVPIFQPVAKRIGTFTPTITPLIRAEFLRKSKSKAEFEKFKQHLNDKFAEINLSNPDDQYDIFNFAGECAVVCRFANKGHAGHIELTDYVHHGLMRHFYKNLYILTFDNNDFPQPIFNILCHESIEVGEQLMIWSLRKFNRGNFSNYFGRYVGASNRR